MSFVEFFERALGHYSLKIPKSARPLSQDGGNRGVMPHPFPRLRAYPSEHP
jgi:hypothetical protein